MTINEQLQLPEPTGDLEDDLFCAIDCPGSTDESDALFGRALAALKTITNDSTEE